MSHNYTGLGLVLSGAQEPSQAQALSFPTSLAQKGKDGACVAIGPTVAIVRADFAR